MRRIFLSGLVMISFLPSICGQIWTQDFEINGLGTAYTSPTVFTANLNAHYNRTTGANISNTMGPYSGSHGSYFWAGENINITTGGGDGLTTKTITFAPINVTGFSGLEFRGLFASGNPHNGWDFSDQLYVEYKMDAGPWTRILQFAANQPQFDNGLYQDNDLNGTGDGIALETIFQQFTASIPVTGVSLQLRIFSKCSAQGEEFAFDFLRLYSLTTAVNGCTDPGATNFSSAATVDDGSCTYSGCTDPLALNYNPNATVDNGSCVLNLPAIVINEIHFNPNDFAGFTDTGFEFIELYNNSSSSVNMGGWRITGAVDVVFATGTTIAANGYKVIASTPANYPGSTLFTDDLSNTGESINLFTNANILVDQVNYFPGGCWPSQANGNGPSLELINPNLDNNQSDNYCVASNNNGSPGTVNSCFSTIVSGCTNPAAMNYDVNANTDDGSCLIAGCVCPDADNYNPSANYDDGSCIFPSPIPGCTYVNATNYNPSATTDDGSCTFIIANSCPADLNGDLTVGVSDLLIFIAAYGMSCQ